MAMQYYASVVSATPYRVEVVGNAFVQQYYHVIHVSPSVVYRFYHDSSLLSRPDSHNGVMKTVTTMRAISGRGILVLVTGKEDNVRRNFAQSFCLAPQATCFFVRNDVSQFVKEKKSIDIDYVGNKSQENDIQECAPMPPSTTELVPAASIPVEHRPIYSTTLLEKEKDIKDDEEVEDEEVDDFIFVRH